MEKHIEQLIEKFWAGTASQEERRILLRYLNEHDHNLREEMGSSFLEVDDPAVLQQVDASFQVELLQKIHEKAGIEMPNKALTRKHRPIAQLAVAASLITAVCVITWFAAQKKEHTGVVTKRAVHAGDSTVYRNNSIAAKRFTLPDRSVVVLEPHSRIDYTTGLGKETRLVNLTGAAKFSVAHDKKRPFTVLTNGYSTTALGTAFAIDAKNPGKIQIELFTGKVLVHPLAQSGAKDVYLKPGDELTISNDNGKFYIVNRLANQRSNDIAKDKPQQHTTVKHNPVLQFSLTPLEQVFARLSKVKNIIIVTDDVDLRNKVFTGRFLPDESLQTMLTIICDVNNLGYRTDNSRIIIEER